MKYVKLEDYIATLSEEEKEQYKRLIQESRERDFKLKKNFEESGKTGPGDRGVWRSSYYF